MIAAKIALALILAGVSYYCGYKSGESDAIDMCNKLLNRRRPKGGSS